MTQSDWTAPVLEEISIPGGTFGEVDDSDTGEGSDEGTTTS